MRHFNYIENWLRDSLAFGACHTLRARTVGVVGHQRFIRLTVRTDLQHAS